jgi:hypothetical protein
MQSQSSSSYTLFLWLIRVRCTPEIAFLVFVFPLCPSRHYCCVVEGIQLLKDLVGVSSRFEFLSSQDNVEVLLASDPQWGKAALRQWIRM